MQICSVSTTFNSLRDTRFLISTEVQEVKKNLKIHCGTQKHPIRKKKKKLFRLELEKHVNVDRKKSFLYIFISKLI